MIIIQFWSILRKCTKQTYKMKWTYLMSQVPRYRKSIRVVGLGPPFLTGKQKHIIKTFGGTPTSVFLWYTPTDAHCSISRSTLAISEKSLESIIFLKKVCVGLLRIVTTAFKLFLYIDWYNLDTNTFSYNVHFLINYDRYLSGTHCDPKELSSILQIFTF